MSDTHPRPDATPAPAAPTTLVTNISHLTTNDPSHGTGPLGPIHDAALVIEGDRIAWIGESSRAPVTDSHHDVGGRAVVPGFVDSHSHLLFAGDRTEEFNARMTGRPYSAGGIRTTVAATRAATDDELAATLDRHLAEMVRQGTTTTETKSGYGLTADDEARALRVAAARTDEVTYLGAHIVPSEYQDDPDGYVALVTGPMLDACAPHARWIDAFCERGAFDGDRTRAVLTAGRARGLTPRVHANQLGPGPGVRIAVELAAASADHCTHLDDTDVDALAQAATAPEPTVATLLPGCEFSTRSPYPDARRLLDAGATVALSTDCNPGSSFTSSMPFCIAVAVREMGMTPEEALWSATAGGAAALRRTDIGTLRPGARADLVVLDAPSPVHLAYRPGVPLVTDVWQAGRHAWSRPRS
ncbi:imidazolonepropionase [Streptomyces spiramenti]|uniref:Imidazolonepropionase n=1 Tax=Streptomyces spiramenti TaxID=2720606 RepID=A0ABX1AXX2_9ACTN|nr:imidazolonepropionase [Streptomyces spiramenti]NJP69242.1 imidazolonepropionase [Streptomyces spiramenti]